MKNNIMYTPQEKLKPQGLIGISDTQIDDHWNLYVGYVNNVNTLNQELLAHKNNQTADSLAYADRRRRYGFEYNGMVLHEYYFGNLAVNTPTLTTTSPLYHGITTTWGSFDNWKTDFINTGKTRGIGWAILYADPTTKHLTNHFIMDHENGPIAGFIPLLVMDVWEHAYMVDHKASGRPAYINAFLQNVHWNVVEKRFTKITHI